MFYDFLTVINSTGKYRIILATLTNVQILILVNSKGFQTSLEIREQSRAKTLTANLELFTLSYLLIMLKKTVVFLIN
jgi:hypothetical protein